MSTTAGTSGAEQSTPVIPPPPPIDEIDLSNFDQAVRDDFDADHPRSRGLVGTVIKIGEKYWTPNLRSAEPLYNCRVFGFVPGARASGDRWYFHMHEEPGTDMDRNLPVKLSAIKRWNDPLPAPLSAGMEESKSAQDPPDDEELSADMEEDDGSSEGEQNDYDVDTDEDSVADSTDEEFIVYDTSGDEDELVESAEWAKIHQEREDFDYAGVSVASVALMDRRAAARRMRVCAILRRATDTYPLPAPPNHHLLHSVHRAGCPQRQSAS